MSTINVKNIAISLCIGVFSCHMYIVENANITYSKELSLYDPGSRSIAAETNLKCKGYKKGYIALTDSNYKPANCQYFILNDSDPATQKITVRFIFKKGDVIVHRPPLGEPHMDVKVEGLTKFVSSPDKKADFTNEQLEKIKPVVRDLYNQELKIAAKAFTTASARIKSDQAYIQHTKRNSADASPEYEIKENEEEQKKQTRHANDSSRRRSEGNSLDGDPVEDQEKEAVAATDVSSTQNPSGLPASIRPTMRPSESPITDEDFTSEVSKEDASLIRTDELKAVLENLDELNLKAQDCKYSAETTEEIEDIKESISSALNQDEEIEKFSKIKSSKLKSLSSRQAQRILDKRQDINAFSEEELDFDDKISCLSSKATQEPNSAAQFQYYQENIQPSIIESLDSVEDLEELQSFSTKLGQNEKLTSLSRDNSLVGLSTGMDYKLATKVMTCKQSSTDEVCKEQLLSDLKKLESQYSAAQTKPNNSEVLSVITPYSYWIKRLGGTEGEIQAYLSPDQSTPGNEVAEAVGEALNNTNATTKAELSRMGYILKQIKTLRNSIRNAKPGSNARKKANINYNVYAKKATKGVDREGTPVSQEELNSVD